MAEETITILKIGTEEAVKNVNDLRANIKGLKTALGELEIGSDEYANTLDELKINQNALKDAMYATTGTFDDVIKSATGASQSYNSLVHQMAALKEEWRATNDEARRNELGVQITEVNKKLKDMDASIGNFQRNVGNYSSALDGLKQGFLATAGGAGAVINPVKNVTMGFQALSSTPVIAILGLLANVLLKVINNLDSSEKSSNRLTLALAPFQAATTLATKVVQFLGDKLASLAEGFTRVLERLGLVNESMREHQDITKEEIALVEDRRKVEKANADDQLEIAKLRASAAEKDKYTAAERLKFIEEASKKEREIADRNVEIARREYEVLKRRADLAENSKEENDALADAYVKLQNEETNYFNKVRELNAQRVEAVNQIKAETKANKDLLVSKQELIDFDKELAEEDLWGDAEKQQAENEVFWEMMHQRLDAKEAAAQQEIDLEKAVADANKEYWRQQQEAYEAMMQNRINTTMQVAVATGDMLSTIADLYESDEKSAERNAKKIKSLRIASATIDMLNGAIGAFSSAAANPGGIPGMIIGAANAAAVVAMGMTNIAKIKATDVSGNVGASAPQVGAVVNAPAVEMPMNSVRSITSASEEERLNQMAKDKRVYILQSDIEASNQQSKVQVLESSF